MSEHRGLPPHQIARAALVIMVAYILSNLVGLARQIVVSQAFGTSAELDAYWAAFRLPDFLFTLVAGGALASAFLPTFTAALARGDRLGAWRLASAVANLVLIILICGAILLAVAAPLLVATVVAPGFSPSQQAWTVHLMRVMVLSPILFGLSGLLSAILNAHQHFLLPAIAPILYNVGIMIGAVFLAPLPGMGVRGLAFGVVLGAALHLAIQLIGLKGRSAQYVPTLGLNDPQLHEVARLMLPRMLGVAVVQLNFQVNTILASGLEAGRLSALTLAWMIFLLPQAVIAQSAATAAFPTLATLVAQGRLDEMRHTLATTLRNVLFLAIPASLGLILLRDPLIRFLFQRGEFDARSTALTSWALGLYALGLVGHSVLEVLVRAFYAMHDTRTPVVVGAGAMGLNIVLSLTLIQVFRPLGLFPHGGLALANSMAATAETLVLVWLIRKRLGGLEGRRTLATLVRASVAALGMALVVLTSATWLPVRSDPWIVASGVALGGGVYLGLSLLLRSEEVHSLRVR
ncbi:MAG: murein biosynthesis integral membrane protein MurJ [Chloroflexota bacterium]